MIKSVTAALHQFLKGPGRFKLLLLLLASACLGSIAPLRGNAASLVQSFEAIPYTGWIPCDPSIAAGPSSLVAMVNSKIVIFDKKGTKFMEQQLWGSSGFWGARGASTSVAEPSVIFDPNSGRFIATAADFGSRKGFIYIAVSTDSMPTRSSDWHKYALDRSGTHQNPGFPGVPTYPDNTKAGVDNDAIYITASHFAKNQNITQLFSHVELFAIEKAPLLSGGTIHIVYEDAVITESYSSEIAFSIHPAVVFDPTGEMYFVQSLTRKPDNKIVVHTLTDVLTSPVRTVSFVPVAPFDRPPDVPQLGSSTPLQNFAAILMSAVVRNGSLWTSHAIRDPAVDSESLVRWYEFDVTGLPGAPATLAQSGNIDPGPGVHAWLPSLSVDASGNMGIGFSVGGANQYAAIGYTGRLASDSPGTTEATQIARSGAGYYGLAGWGEYSGFTVDPDGCTFWLFHEYPTSTHQWGTFIGAFQMDPCPVVTIASDGFESNNYDGGSGNWAGSWAHPGDVSILTSSGPAVGSRHVRLRSSTGILQRTVNVGGATSLRLEFWAKVDSFEGNDAADVKVSPDGVNFTTIWPFVATDSDGLYHYYEFDLTDFLAGSPSQIQIAFDAGMSDTKDNWYLDGILITGTY